MAWSLQNDPAAMLAESPLGQSELSQLEPRNAYSASRGIIIELAGNLVIFIICTLVCLNIFAIAQSDLEKSRAVSELGLTSMNLVENWQAGSDLAELSQRFGGIIENDTLVLYFDRSYQQVTDLSQARYRLEFSVDQQTRGYSAGQINLSQNDGQRLLQWSVGRVLLDEPRP